MASPYSTTTIIAHNSTASFRAWGLEFSTALSTIGLVQTADTGQINWTTVNYNSTGGTVAGYEVWKFADSTIYMLFEYGTDTNGAGYPVIWLTCGTGSNGSGTITGTNQTSTRNKITSNQLPSTVTSYTSYWSRTAGHFAVCWKRDGWGNVYALGGVIVGKSVDSTGATTTTGYGVFRLPPSSFQCVRLISTAQVFNDVASGYCCVPGFPTSSVDDAGNYQAYMFNMNLPKVLPFMYANGVNFTDIPKGTSFSVAQVGSTPRTYLSLGQQPSSIGQSSAVGLAMLYE